MKIDFTEEEIYLLTALVGIVIEAENKNIPSIIPKEGEKSFFKALVGLSLKVLMANRELENQHDEAIDAEIL